MGEILYDLMFRCHNCGALFEQNAVAPQSRKSLPVGILVPGGVLPTMTIHQDCGHRPEGWTYLAPLIRWRPHPEPDEPVPEPEVPDPDNWNDLTPEERQWVERKQLADAEIKTARANWRAYVGEHTCRWREEEPYWTDSFGDHHYARNPTCLLCGNDNDMEVYCHQSPDRICHFIVDEAILCLEYGPNREDYPETVTATDLLGLQCRHSINFGDNARLLDDAICIHCNQRFERSE
jgi:hypothetical protein